MMQTQPRDDDNLSIETVFDMIKNVPELAKENDDLQCTGELISVARQDYQHQTDLSHIDSYFDDPRVPPISSLTSTFATESETQQSDILKEIQSKLANLKKELEETEELEAKYPMSALSCHEKLSNQVKVYGVASKVLWNADAPPNVANGYVISQHGPKSFKWDLNESSPFNMCNEIWKLTDRNS